MGSRMWYLSFSDQTASFLAMPGWGKKAVDPDRIHPVLSMFLDRREELFFLILIFSFSFFLFFFFFFHFVRSPIAFRANKWHHSPQEYPTISCTTDTINNNCNYRSYYGFNDSVHRINQFIFCCRFMQFPLQSVLW
jgi:hypothetical protein